MKREVNHDYEIPKEYQDYTEMLDCGGYKAISNKDGISIIGNTIFNINESPICECCITPVTKDKLKEGEHHKNSIYNTVNLKDKTIYFLVGYGDRAYIFNTYMDAAKLVAIFLEVKIHALERGFKG